VEIVHGGVDISCSHAIPGNNIIISGSIGNHEIGVLLACGEFSLKGEIKSDCAPLNGLVQKMIDARSEIHALRDPTRGKLATVLWEIANSLRV
jgi:hydrogenase expression/formation protein HypE